MQMKLNIAKKQQLVFFILLTALGTVWAAEPQPLIIHHLNQNGSTFSVTGNDPYLIFTPDHPAINIDTQTGVASLKIAFSKALSDEILGELFITKLNQDHNADIDQITFDQYQRIRFSTTTNDFGALNIPIPKQWLTDAKQLVAFRLDFDLCANCQFNFPNLTIDKPLHQAKTVRVYSGVQNLPTAGIKIGASSWQLNQFEAITPVTSQEDALTLTNAGPDPYIVSSPLDTQTDDLAGFFFEIELLNSDLTIYQPTRKNPAIGLELFYWTDRHAFQRTEYSLIRAPIKSGKTPIFIPLAFLSQQNSPAAVLEKIRIDFQNGKAALDSEIESPQLASAWRLSNAKLVHINEAKNYQEFVPRIVNLETKTSTWRYVVRDISKRISQDLTFFIPYALLLFLLGIKIIRRFVANTRA